MDYTSLQAEFFRVSHRFGKIHMAALFNDLSKGEFIVMETLCHFHEEHPDEKGIYASNLANKTHASPPAVSRILKGLEGRGLIERTTDVENRRNTHIRLTEAGNAILSDSKERVQSFLNCVFARMGEENVQAMLTLWQQMVDISESEIQKIQHREVVCSKSSKTSETPKEPFS